jgi:hypothetical protein
MVIKRYGHYWAVYDTAGVLVCIRDSAPLTCH